MAPNMKTEKMNGLMIIFEIVVTGSLMICGGLVGERLTRYVAPGNGLLELAGLITLPLALVTGLVLWQGLALVREIWRSRHKRSDNAFQWRRPDGVAMLLPTSLLASAMMGGIATGSSSFSTSYVLYLYLMVGALFGSLSWLLGHWGYFDFWKWIGVDSRS